MSARALRLFVTWSVAHAALALLVLAPSTAHAVPSMARQTGMECAACHTVFPNLTPFGRQFKLRGFSLSSGQAQDSMFGKWPIAFLVQGSLTSTNKTDTPGATTDDFPKNDKAIVQAAGVYYGGQIYGNSGALVQYSYDGIEKTWLMEMFDVRYANSATPWGGKELLYGVTLNNQPTLTDVYNSTPAWAFPHTDTAAVQPNARTLVDQTLAGQVGGPSVYAFWNSLLYGEVAVYKSTRSGLFQPLGWGWEKDDVVKGATPYWRLALQHETGPHSFTFGTYGLEAKVYAEHDDFALGTNRFRDVAFDGQYQYISDPHIVTADATWIRERQRWNASVDAGLASTVDATLTTFRLSAHYFYQRKWGGGVQYFATSGTSDPLRYDTGAPVTGSVAGSPNNKGWMAELNYLPWPSVKLALRYTWYREFNGSRENYDGFGRNAADNNSLFVLAWVLF